MKKRAKEWIKYSKLDLDSALKLLESPELIQSAAFHCQQSIEKSLKAIIEEKTNKVPRTHDLEKLYGLMEVFTMLKMIKIRERQINAFDQKRGCFAV